MQVGAAISVGAQAGNNGVGVQIMLPKMLPSARRIRFMLVSQQLPCGTDIPISGTNVPVVPTSCAPVKAGLVNNSPIFLKKLIFAGGLVIVFVVDAIASTSAMFENKTNKTTNNPLAFFQFKCSPSRSEN